MCTTACCICSFYASRHPKDLRSFPTRRSSDLVRRAILLGHSWGGAFATAFALAFPERTAGLVLLSAVTHPDRKSTRLNSSHRCISYAVFCLKKKRGRLLRPMVSFQLLIVASAV